MVSANQDEIYFRTVYYSDFWYSRHFKANEATVGANIVRTEADLHRFRLRILSLFFETLYIPRTHLITSVFPDQYRIADSIIDTNEFGTLFECDSLRVSSYPGLDAKEDNLRILERQTEAEDVIYPDDNRFLAKIPITRKFEVNTSRESASNAVTFPQYGELLQAYNPKIGKLYSEIVKRSNLKDIPFFHERFLMLVRQELPAEIFEPVWRNTNSIYLTSGASEHESFIAYFNEEIENPDFRFAPHGIDRYLFSPSSLYTFLTIFLSTLEMTRLLYDDMRITHQPLLDDTMRKAMARFRRDYQRIAWTISRITGQGRLRSYLDQSGLRVLFELALDGEHGQLSRVAQEALADAQSATTAHGGLIGLAGSVVNTGTKYGGRFLQNRSRRRRFPGLYDVVDRLVAATREK